jgi:hypothetical protein
MGLYPWILFYTEKMGLNFSALKMIASGASLAIAILIKPVAILYLGLILLMVLTSPKKDPFRLIGYTLAGALLATGTVFFWLWTSGALGGLFTWSFEFVTKYLTGRERTYSQFFKQIWTLQVNQSFYGAMMLGGLASVAWLMVLKFKERAFFKRWRTGVVFSSLLCAGLISYFWQGKAWLYHLFPFQSSCALLFAYSVGRVTAHYPRLKLTLAQTIIIGVCLSVIFSSFIDPPSHARPSKLIIEELRNQIPAGKKAALYGFPTMELLLYPELIQSPKFPEVGTLLNYSKGDPLYWSVMLTELNSFCQDPATAYWIIDPVQYSGFLRHSNRVLKTFQATPTKDPKMTAVLEQARNFNDCLSQNFPDIEEVEGLWLLPRKL